MKFSFSPSMFIPHPRKTVWYYHQHSLELIRWSEVHGMICTRAKNVLKNKPAANKYLWSSCMMSQHYWWLMKVSTCSVSLLHRTCCVSWRHAYIEPYMSERPASSLGTRLMQCMEGVVTSSAGLACCRGMRTWPYPRSDYIWDGWLVGSDHKSIGLSSVSDDITTE